MIEGAAPKLYQSTLRKIPLGRMGAPEELAELLVVIDDESASPAAGFVVGANILADGGFTKGGQL